MPPVELSGGAISVAATDLDGDELPELAVAVCNNRCSENRIAIFYGLGNGEFTLAHEHEVIGVPYNLKFAYLGSNREPVLLASDHPGNAILLFHNLLGESVEQVTVPAGPNPIDLLVGDVSANGKLAVFSLHQKEGSVWGFFVENNELVGPVITDVGKLPYNASLALLDNDEYLDLLVAHSDSPGALSIWKGKGDGSFEFVNEMIFSDRLISVSAVDLNGNDLDDVVVTYEKASAATVLMNKGGFVFEVKQELSYLAKNRIFSTALGDFNKDGLYDLATIDFEDDSLAIALGERS
jgi:hypothetical protein